MIHPKIGVPTRSSFQRFCKPAGRELVGSIPGVKKNRFFINASCCRLPQAAC